MLWGIAASDDCVIYVCCCGVSFTITADKTLCNRETRALLQHLRFGHSHNHVHVSTCAVAATVSKGLMSLPCHFSTGSPSATQPSNPPLLSAIWLNPSCTAQLHEKERGT